MTDVYTLHAWELSLYSGKARAYLRYKALPFHEKRPSLLGMRRIRKAVHATVMPVLVTPDGQWLQDTSTIIDELEARHPEAPVVPATPRQRVAAYLLEAWGDEFWLPPAMHYRWNFPENFQELFRIEAGDNLLPSMPRFLKDAVADKSAGMLRGFLPGLGVNPAQQERIEAWTEAMLDALETHFAAYDYLLGSRPSIGDFGLIGPLYAHLGRDPWPRRHLIEPRSNLAAWVQRMQQPPAPRGGEFLCDDAVPDTLAPIFASVFGEFWPQLDKTQALVDKALPALAPGRGLPRQIGEITIPYGKSEFTLQARPFSLWMAQRAFDAWAALDADGQAAARDWLATVGGQGMFNLKISPRLERQALQMVPAAEER